jgi:hypothetical protein
MKFTNGLVMAAIATVLAVRPGVWAQPQETNPVAMASTIYRIVQDFGH